MPRNIEVKFSHVDLDTIRKAANAMGAADQGILEQVDTFFCCANGRLKLRELGTGPAELIAYDRANEMANRASDYQIARTTDPATLLAVLARSCGVTGRVAKRRNLWMWRNVRIHLDAVEGLGEFCELESVVGDDVDESVAREHLDIVIRGLNLVATPRLAVAYVDLLASQTAGGSSGS